MVQCGFDAKVKVISNSLLQLQATNGHKLEFLGHVHFHENTELLGPRGVLCPHAVPKSDPTGLWKGDQ